MYRISDDESHRKLINWQWPLNFLLNLISTAALEHGLPIIFTASF
jgi:hypothetical protein